MSNYEIRTLDTAGEIGEAAGWLQQIRSGFLQTRASQEALDHWWQAMRADDVRLTGAFTTGTTSDAAWSVPDPIATLGSVTHSVNTGGGHLEPADFIVDVTVRPSHRRQGILRDLMTRELRSAAERGLSMATLTSSEGGIYRRFGFGPATGWNRVTVDTSARFAFRRPVAIRVAAADPSAVKGVRAQLFAAFHAVHRGSHERLAEWSTWLAGEWDPEPQCAPNTVRCAVHLDEQGHPDGIVTYAIKDDAIQVRELVTTDPGAELGLWAFLAGIDLVDKAKFRHHNPVSPLPHALVDPRVTQTERGDFTWLRILDVERALGVRGWDGHGDVTLRVMDELGLASGTWHVHVDDADASIEPTTAAPEVTLDVAALGELYFGLAHASTLAGAGEIDGDADAIRRLGRLFATDLPPYNITPF